MIVSGSGWTNTPGERGDGYALRCVGEARAGSELHNVIPVRELRRRPRGEHLSSTPLYDRGYTESAFRTHTHAQKENVAARSHLATVVFSIASSVSPPPPPLFFFFFFFGLFFAFPPPFREYFTACVAHVTRSRRRQQTRHTRSTRTDTQRPQRRAKRAHTREHRHTRPTSHTTPCETQKSSPLEPAQEPGNAGLSRYVYVHFVLSHGPKPPSCAQLGTETSPEAAAIARCHDPAAAVYATAALHICPEQQLFPDARRRRSAEASSPW